IPVFVISTEEDRQRGLRLGAAGVMVKPIATREQLVGMLESVKAFLHRPRRRLLLLEPDAAQYGEMVDLVACNGVEPVRLECEREAVEALRRGDGDCLIVGPNVSGSALMEVSGSLLRQAPSGETPMI